MDTVLMFSQLDKIRFVTCEARIFDQMHLDDAGESVTDSLSDLLFIHMTASSTAVFGRGCYLHLLQAHKIF